MKLIIVIKGEKMKRQIQINIDKNYCVGCTETICTHTDIEYLKCRVEDKTYKTETIPTSWEDLCIKISLLPKNKQGLKIKIEPKNAICNHPSIIIYGNDNKGKKYIIAEFWHNALRFWTLQLNATIPQIWDVIKSIMLTGVINEKI